MTKLSLSRRTFLGGVAASPFVISGLVDPARVLVYQDLGSRHSTIRPAVESVKQSFEPLRLGFRIVIQQRDELGLGRLNALVIRCAESAILAIPDEAGSREFLLHHFR